MNERSPPRVVPTLTEVVAPLPFGAAGDGLPDPAQAQWVQRTVERLQPVLDARLRAAIEQVVLEHTQALAPRLQQEIEAAVQAAVAQVLAQDRQS